MTRAWHIFSSPPVAILIGGLLLALLIVEGKWGWAIAEFFFVGTQVAFLVDEGRDSRDTTGEPANADSREQP